MKTADAPPADPKAKAHAALTTTLDAIAQAEQAERQAAKDAYQALVADLTDGKTDLSAAAVVAILKRAGRTSDELHADVKLAAELVRLEGEYAKLDELRAAEAAAKEVLAAALAEQARVAAEAEKPVAAAAYTHDRIREQVQACHMKRVRIHELKRQQEARDAKRSGAEG